MAPVPAQLNALRWDSFSVRRIDKEPLLEFITDALQMRGCRIIRSGDAKEAPFYIVFDTPDGERHGLLAYAFFANSKRTKNRPNDEHRFQIKYGSDLKAVLNVAIDPSGLITTIFLGIDPFRKIFVAADPVMNTPAPMSRSVEFKSDHVDEVLREGWSAWERDRRPAKTKTRAAYQLEEDTRTEILIGARQERLLDLIALERIARNLDPGERHLLADTFRHKQSAKSSTVPHALLDELKIGSGELFDLIANAGRLRMAVRGWVAEKHLEDQLRRISGVTECRRIEDEGKPDISLRWRDSRPILIECKNSLRTTYAGGDPKVDFQRTRASKGDPCSRYYTPADFHMLAACLHSVTAAWEFRYALTRELPEHGSCKGHIANTIRVTAPHFTENVEFLFDKCSHQ